MSWGFLRRLGVVLAVPWGILGRSWRRLWGVLKRSLNVPPPPVRERAAKRRSSLYVLPIVQDVLRRSQGFFRRSCPRRRWFKKFPQDVALGLLLNALPVLMLATGFFWSRSLDVFHYFGAAKPSKMNPQHGAMLDPVLGSILDRFGEVFLEVLGTSWGCLRASCGSSWSYVGARLGIDF